MPEPGTRTWPCSSPPGARSTPTRARSSAEDIPTYALLAEGFYERREVWDLVLALETVRDPRDDRALLGFLRSPFVGVKDETLLDIVRQTSRPVWSDRPGEGRGAGAARLRRRPDPRSRRAARPGPDPRAAGEPARALGLPRAPRRPRRLRPAAAGQRPQVPPPRARVPRRQRRRLPPRHAARRRSGRSRRADERLYGQHENVVTITSVHSAKGLEWPIVFWADLAREPRVSAASRS